MKHINIGEAELEIMKVVWKSDEPIGSTAIGKAVEEKGWKRTTIATFLARLVEKGALSAERRGKAWKGVVLHTDFNGKGIQKIAGKKSY